VTTDTGVRQPEFSCFIATTPWCGSDLLCQALEASGKAGKPRDYFDPLAVVSLSVEWGLLGPGQDHLPRQPQRDFAARYLNAVTKAAMGRNGVLSVSLPWSHQRWLTRFTRAAVPDVPGDPTRSDAEIIEEWYPQSRYLYLTSADTAWQAGRWYLGRNVGPVAPGPARGNGAGPNAEARPGQPADFQKVRWIETLIFRQEHAWETYFRLHAIDAHRITYEDFLAKPDETVTGILQWLGLPGAPVRRWDGARQPQDLARPGGWLDEYVVARDQLSPAIGVYGGRA
jgi:trehalose 2-sulfotransferase